MPYALSVLLLVILYPAQSNTTFDAAIFMHAEPVSGDALLAALGL